MGIICACNCSKNLYSKILMHMNLNKFSRLNRTENKLERLERLRSEDTPAASWLPILLSHIGSQVRRRQSQSYKFKEFDKISNFETSITRDTPSEVAW